MVMVFKMTIIQKNHTQSLQPTEGYNIALSVMEIPRTYNEAIASPQAYKWNEAIRRELRCTNTNVPSSEATSEIMALFGPQLVAISEVEQGENTLNDAICVALHCKNVLLQTRLLAAVFEHYIKNGLVQAQAAATNKYEKRFTVWKGCVAADLSKEVTTAALVRWTVGSSSSSKTVDTLG
ncbi:hypothetical protein PsorP6_016300 [Peronosclerospora sorghi]|uniref:Uncharacterized protein n=1 Tax=Peronosclerospora sorghi TaxID=230839 RepID=A0ACC0VNE9_9STRA|nr:hypothetical protein PsorP6_016300 [Peronosclerospora sorghi]